MFLHVNHLQVHFQPGSPAAVDDVGFGLQAGDIGVLLGPSGCGKTTLLRAIAGLEPVSRGDITLAGRVVSGPSGRLAPEARQIGMVFQDYALFPHLDIGRNVAFGLHGQAKNQQRQRVDEVLALVGLNGMQHRYPHELSGGQQQRVALARALAPAPRLLLLDEPFSNLDIDLRERLAHEVRSILKASGTTALWVTHDQQEAFAIGDVVGVMHQGQLHQWDEAYVLYHRPATRFVANFIGHGVFAPARIERSASGVQVHTPLGPLIDPSGCPLPSAYPNGECDILLRADDIVHDEHSPVQARVLRKAFRGADSLYTLELPSGTQVLAHIPSHHDHAIGDFIGITVAMDHVVTFGREPAAVASLAPVRAASAAVSTWPVAPRQSLVGLRSMGKA